VITTCHGGFSWRERRETAGYEMYCTHHMFNIQKLLCRVVEVHDVYGVNITYEVARPAQRENFFKCSLSECHLNGECLVQVPHAFPQKYVILRAFQKVQ
jgi:hypothetical protein